MNVRGTGFVSAFGERCVVLIVFGQHEQIIKRRAEQSARDKERHRRMLEERKKVESPSQSEQSEYLPLTPVSARPESVYVSLFLINS